MVVSVCLSQFLCGFHGRHNVYRTKYSFECQDIKLRFPGVVSIIELVLPRDKVC